MTLRNAVLLLITICGLLASYLVYNYQFQEPGLFSLMFQLIFPGAAFLLLAYYFAVIDERSSVPSILITFTVMAVSVLSPYVLPFFIHSAVISAPLIFIAMPFYSAVLTLVALGSCRYLAKQDY